MRSPSKYSQRRRADSAVSAAKRRKTMRDIDRRTEEIFWSHYEKPCHGCGVPLTGNESILGYCEECREKRTTDFNNERYIKSQNRIAAHEYANQQAAKRAK